MDSSGACQVLACINRMYNLNFCSESDKWEQTETAQEKPLRMNIGRLLVLSLPDVSAIVD
jgi:hypothetical protein